MNVRDFCFLIFCYGRPNLALTHSWKLIKSFSEKRTIIVLSDDDPTIPEYIKTFGKENIYIFNKEEIEKKTRLDIMDCYYGEHNNKKGTVWVRNAQYTIARELGYRYFSAWDDDTVQIRIRNPVIKNQKFYLSSKHYIPKLPSTCFDEICELYFRMLDSAPWLYSLAFSQGGDFIGGIKCQFYTDGSKFKAMNLFFGDTEKELRFNGRMNDDVNCYVEHGKLGHISLTINNGIMIDQEPTQQNSGGMQDIYLAYGTYLKSLYTSILLPSGSNIATIGYTKYTKRIHHRIVWNSVHSFIVPNRYSKGIPLDYKKEVMKTDYGYDKEKGEYIYKEKEYSFMDKECELLEQPFSLHTTIDNFF